MREIPIELVHRNPDQPRRHFAEDELAELAASIRDKGVLQPILVRPVAEDRRANIEIVAGERRWRAAQQAGLQAIPALVRDLDDDKAFEIAIVENVQRADLNAMEEAQAYQPLMRPHRPTPRTRPPQRSASSRSHVANTLRLLQLPESGAGPRAVRPPDRRPRPGDPQRGLPRGAGASHCRQRPFGPRRRGPGARQGATRPKKASGPRRAAKDTDTAALEADLEDALGMSVDIVDRGGAGELRIKYATLEQLDELCRRLTRR